MKKSFFIILLLFSLAGFAEARTMYIQSMTAKIVDNPTFRAKNVLLVKKGDQVEVIQQKGRWLKVSSQGKQGWISKFLLDNHPPVKKVNVLVRENQIISNVRRRASAVTTAGAARGLSADQRRRASSKGGSNFIALEKLEMLGVTDEDVRLFVMEGRI
ncbi:MAG: SH3 domain-containing protein [Gammaproteobacteria bacterium]|nr:SH3 domain-containing protein [Gammaproteobacteria bacterium]